MLNYYVDGKLDETVADKIPSGSITRFNSAYSTATSPFDDEISRAGSYTYLNRLRGRKAGTVRRQVYFAAGGNYTSTNSKYYFSVLIICTTGKYYWEVDNLLVELMHCIQVSLQNLIKVVVKLQVNQIKLISKSLS